MSFAADLAQYGPASRRPISLGEAQSYCARLAATHYENFSVVGWLTPKALRPAFEAVYAFCRWADDLGDEVGDSARALELLAWWRGELHALYRGDATHPVFVALAPVVERYQVPIEPFDRLIQAFEQDQTVTRYETAEQLRDYCRLSANPVGHLVLYLCGCFDDANAVLSDQTCTGLQLANFWQDVARDLAIGRIYLPRADMERFGVSEADLSERLCQNLEGRGTVPFLQGQKGDSPRGFGTASKTPTPANVLRLIQHEVFETAELLARGRPLVLRVPREVAVAIDLFNRGGFAILERIRKQKYDVLRARPKLGRTDKARLALHAIKTRYLGNPRDYSDSGSGFERP